MSELAATLTSAFDLLLVVLGFGLLIVIHELGHFLAARWAGIRVLAFAVGMGPALVSWRKGLGWRRGSSEREYMTRANAAPAGATTIEGRHTTYHSISPTEYRLNALPFGGYVKMLGQDDANPNAVSDAADSYQRCPVWKRMIVISAGVVANALAAACIFVIVFRIGLATEPPVIGDVAPGSAAATAVATNAVLAGVSEPGLRPGDRIVDLDDSRPESFSDLTLATAMAPKDEPIVLRVLRPGVDETLKFSIKPKVGAQTGLLELGVEPPRTARIVTSRRAREHDAIAASLGKYGLPGVRPGMTLVRIGDSSAVRGAEDLNRAARESDGSAFEAEFNDEKGTAIVEVRPRAELQVGLVKRADKTFAIQNHLLGLTPVLRVDAVAPEAAEQGLRADDVFVRVGTLEYPSVSAGTGEIRAHAGHSISAVVERTRSDGVVEQVPLTLKVGRKGTVGFYPGDTSDLSTRLAAPPTLAREGEKDRSTPAGGLAILPGSRVEAVDGRQTSNFTELREALRDATARVGPGPAEVSMTVRPSALPDGPRPTENMTLRLTPEEVRSLHALSWQSPISPGAFELEQTTLKAETAGDALRMGLRETHRVMLSVYTTFARLFEQTVKIEHLKGPVGIAHLGTRIADRGYIWLLFFMGLISANLAVINFLPLPIVDGGQFLFLVAEGIRGKPVPLAVQNVATIVGLVMIGSMFLVVTFNDVVGLFGG